MACWNCPIVRWVSQQTKPPFAGDVPAKSQLWIEVAPGDLGGPSQEVAMECHGSIGATERLCDYVLILHQKADVKGAKLTHGGWQSTAKGTWIDPKWSQKNHHHHSGDITVSRVHANFARDPAIACLPISWFRDTKYVSYYLVWEYIHLYPINCPLYHIVFHHIPKKNHYVWRMHPKKCR
jgi:hypothetical protein